MLLPFFISFKTSYYGGASARIRMIGKRVGKISYSSIDTIFKGRGGSVHCLNIH